jgi:beta-lactamase class A
MTANLLSHRTRAALLALVFAFCAPGALKAQNPQRTELAQKFRAQLADISRRAEGVVGVAVIDLVSGERFGVNETLVFPQGSAIKIPLLIELFRQADAGHLSLTERVPIRASDQVGGTGVAQWFGDAESTLSWHDLAVLMIVLSDNTATNLVINKVGMPAVNAQMAAAFDDSSA